MKKSLVILTAILAFGLVFTGCKKKSSKSEGTKKAAKLSDTTKSELGFSPKIVVTLNLDSMKKSSIYNKMVKKELSKKIGKDPCVADLVTSIKKVDLVSGSGDLDDKKAAVVAAIYGMDAKKALSCISGLKSAKVTKEKLNGKDYIVINEKDEKTYFFKASDKAVVFGTKKGLDKLVQGKGTFGTGNVAGFVGSESISIKATGIKGKAKNINGSIDLSDGLSINGTATLVNEADAKKAEKMFEQFKKFPGLGDMVKKLSLSRSGASLTLRGKLSTKDIESLMKNPMLKGM